MDLGRLPEARFPGEEVILDQTVVTEEDLSYVTTRIGAFGGDNRAGIERTLHRISAIRNRRGKIIGLTCRVGRAVYGTVALIRDVIEQGRSLLILGRPGVGKTTMLRETARVLADDLGKRVVIVDTSNEIAGDGDVPHPGIGRARRMQVPRPAEQHAVMIEAVENHMPEVIIIDEIGTELEALAARTIAERGVQLVGTAHGNTLDNLLLNPTLSDLVGGISSVTLGDEEARRRGTQKTVLERKSPPTFDVVVEQQERLRVLLHPDIAAAVDGLLRGERPSAEERVLDDRGQLRRDLRVVEAQRPELAAQVRGAGQSMAQFDDGGRRRHGDRPGSRLARSQSGGWSSANVGPVPANLHPIAAVRANLPPVVPTGYLTAVATRPAATTEESPPIAMPRQDDQSFHLAVLGINRERVEQAAHELGIRLVVEGHPEDADVILSHQNAYSRQRDRLHSTAAHVPVVVLRGRNQDQIRLALARIIGKEDEVIAADQDGHSPEQPSWREHFSDVASESDAHALQEAEDAILFVLRGAGKGVELTPQRSYIRRLQHLLAERYNVGSRSLGHEPYRRVCIYSA